jgi:hypothetical protein
MPALQPFPSLTNIHTRTEQNTEKKTSIHKNNTLIQICILIRICGLSFVLHFYLRAYRLLHLFVIHYYPVIKFINVIQLSVLYMNT